jgi:hypothetical protein
VQNDVEQETSDKNVDKKQEEEKFQF